MTMPTDEEELDKLIDESDVTPLDMVLRQLLASLRYPTRTRRERTIVGVPNPVTNVNTLAIFGQMDRPTVVASGVLFMSPGEPNRPELLIEMRERWDLGEGAEGRIEPGMREENLWCARIHVTVPLDAPHVGDTAWANNQPVPAPLVAVGVVEERVFHWSAWDFNQTDPTLSRWHVCLTVRFPENTTQAAIVAAAKAAAEEMAGWFRGAPPAPPVTRRLW